MKKLSILLCLLFVAQLAVAQGQFTKKINASDEDIANEKKKNNPKTWIARGDLFRQIAEQPAEGLLPGMEKGTLKLMLKGQQEIESKTWTSPDGEQYTVSVYPDKGLYYNSTGHLVFWDVTKTEVEAPLDKAMEAYKQAEKLDPSSKALKDSYQKLANIYNINATSAYMLGDTKKALENFQKLYECNSSAPVGMVDTLTMYNIAFLASTSGDHALAEEFFQKAIDNGYTKGGALYANLADAMAANGKEAEAEKVLADAYAKYPTNQSILISLVNYYIKKGDNPDKVIPIIKKAQENEPSNATLYYAEGMLYEKLNDFAKAEQAYKEAIKKDSKNFYAHYSLGALYYNQAVELGKQADALPINDPQSEYDALVKQMNDKLKQSIQPFEEAYKVQAEPVVVESLKNLYYRFAEESPEMKKNFEKYDAIYKEMQEKGEIK